MSDKTMRDKLIAHEKLCYDMALSLRKDPSDVNIAAGGVLESRNTFLASFLHACSHCGYTGVCSAHQRPDPTCKTCFLDVPEGPHYVQQYLGPPDTHCVMRSPDDAVRFSGFETECIVVCNELNRLDAQEGKTDGNKE